MTKLLRVFLLEPWIIALYYLGIGQKTKGSEAKAGKGVPWFAFGFIGVATVNSVRSIPITRACTPVTTLGVAPCARAAAAVRYA